MIARLCLAALLFTSVAHADPLPDSVRRARLEKHIGIGLAVGGMALSLVGGVFAIVNRGFDRDTPEQRVRFGLSVGLAAGAAPIVTTGVTLWAHGAVKEKRERARLGLTLNGLVGEF